VVPPPADARADWEILYDLGMRLGGLHFGSRALNRLAWLGWRAGLRLTPDRLLDLMLRAGAYGDHFLPGARGLSLRKLRRSPHGVDLGPLMPARARKVRTPDGRIDLAPQVLMDDAARLERWLRVPPPELVLIGRRHLRSNNSWMHNVRSLVKGPDRSSLLIHPSDAERLGLDDGAQVTVRSHAGAVSARVERTDAIMPGVVSLPHGFGHSAAAASLKIAGALAGPNLNALTDAERVEPLLGTAILNGVPVTVSRSAIAAGETPYPPRLATP
jgi:anaerobic selenocysteine-containing dehydrogenase